MSSKSVGFIPVGGSGGAMQPLTSYMPKCLAYVGKYTLLEHAIMNILHLTPDAIYFISNNNNMWPAVKKEVIKISSFFKNTNTRFEFIVLRNDVSNTGSILKLIPELVNETHKLVSFFPDVYLSNINDMKDLLELHMTNLSNIENYTGTILGSEYKQTYEGIIKEENGIVTKFIEKPSHSNGIIYNTAISIFEPHIIKHINNELDGLFSNLVPAAIQNGKIFGVHKTNNNKAWFHLRTAAELHDLNQRLIEVENINHHENIPFSNSINFKEKII